MLLRDMVEDRLTGLLVDPSWEEPPLMVPPRDIIDGQTLYRPAPDMDKLQIGTEVFFGTLYDFQSGGPPRPLAMKFACGIPTVAVA